MLNELFEQATEAILTRARRLVESHDRHDPKAIGEIQEIYSVASQKLGGGANEHAKTRKRKALARLRELDLAGLACHLCAPESACELEKP